MAGRGKITDEIKAKAKELLGIEDLSTQELRLMPYVQFVMMNEQHTNRTKLSDGDAEILGRWQVKGWICGPHHIDMGMSKEFWLAINELIWMAYVEHED